MVDLLKTNFISFFTIVKNDINKSTTSIFAPSLLNKSHAGSGAKKLKIYNLNAEFSDKFMF